MRRMQTVPQSNPSVSPPGRAPMSSAAGAVENASIIAESVAHEGNRLWIGNIDPKITE